MRIVIAEDSALLRAGIERILTDAGHEVVAGVPDATNLLRLVNEKQPDLAIVDVRMPPTFTDEGIRAAALLRSQNPESPVLVLSHYVEERYAAELIASDTKGFGYLLKDRVADVPAFLDAVEAVGGGGTVLDPEVVSQILVRSHRRSALHELTPREREVLQLMAEGKTNSAIAAALYISSRLRRETHRVDLHQVRPGSRREREPPRAGGAALPRILNRWKDFDSDYHRSPTAGTGHAAASVSGGRTAVRIALIAAAAVLVVGSLASLGTVAWGIAGFRVITDSKPLPSGMRSVVVDTGSVPIAIRITTDREAREPRADLRMVNSTRAGANPLVVIADPAGARVTINGESSAFLQWGRAGEINLVLPPDLGRKLTVTAQQDTGVVLAEADIDQLIAYTDTGAVVLSGAARRIEIHNVDGDVVTRDPIRVTESFSATTDTGDITVDFADTAPRTVDATSQDGDVIIALPARGPYVVNANSGDGSTAVRVSQTTNRENAAAVVTARSDTGDVVIDDLR